METGTDILDFSVQLAYGAYLITDWFRNKELNKFEKTDGTPVTLADLSSQIYILSQIKHHYPEHSIIGEEDAAAITKENEKIIKKCFSALKEELYFTLTEDIRELIKYKGPKEETSYTWTVDPIDGTKGYVRGLAYAVGICLLKNLTPYITAIAVPKYKDRPVAIFSAQKEKGAQMEYRQKNQVEQKPQVEKTQIHVSETETFEEAYLTRSLHHSVGWEEDFMDFTNITDEKQMDGMGKACMVAEGEADIYFRPYPTKDQHIWDVAPVDLIVREAGGTVCDFKGNDIQYQGEHAQMQTYGYFATNKALANKVLDALDKQEIKNIRKKFRE